jgi:Ca2+-binding RTX toxin-like protein
MAVINGGNGGTYFGTFQSDIFYGTGFDETFWAFDGDDQVYGNAGNDFLTEASIDANSSDTLDGGAGADTLAGGKGSDIYYVDTVNDIVGEGANNGNDLIYSSVFDNPDTTLPENVENLVLTGTRDRNGIGNTLDNGIDGNIGNNVLNGFSGNDDLNGYGGNDILIGSSGNDSLIGSSGNDYLDGGDSNDSLGGSEGDDTILGSSGNDYIIDFGFTYQGNDSIDGGGDNDTVGGSVGNDIVNGGAGNDFLIGYTGGIDTLTGGTGGDTFEFNISSYSYAEGIDKITDFNFAEGDKISITIDDVNNTPISYFSYDQGSGNLFFDNPSDNISPTVVVTLQANLGNGFIPSEDIILNQVIF